MKNLHLKTAYSLNSAWNLIRRKGLACPSCGALKSTKIKRKYLVMTLMRCNSCKLLFRVPTTNPTENENFYQRTYQQGFTTEMPSLAALSKLKSLKFQNTEKNYTHYIDILNALGLKKNSRILDFGCSWGYGSWQFKQGGYDVQSFEISRPRCEYAIRHMNVDATWNLDDLRGPFDVFFSSHVIEHVPSVKETILLPSPQMVQMRIGNSVLPVGNTHGALSIQTCSMKSTMNTHSEIPLSSLDRILMIPTRSWYGRRRQIAALNKKY